MRKLSLLLASFLLCLNFAALPAQEKDTSVYGKMDAVLRLQLRRAGYEAADGVLKRSASPARRAQADTVFHLLVRCTDSEALTETLRADGYEAHPIVPNLCVVRTSASRLSRLAGYAGVEQLCGSRKAHLMIDVSRSLTGMDRVGTGDGLDSPFDGTGVVAGVIDQGFEYNHPAFSTPEGELRIKYLWDERQGHEPLTDPDSIRMAENDGPDEIGHATHVANIAAGSPVAGAEELHGYAPGADLAFVSSSFQEGEILVAARRIIDQAHRLGKPCVINMSFGGNVYSHDGLTPFEQAFNEMAGEGVLFAASVGNCGTYSVHVEKRFASERDTLRLLLEPNGSEVLCCLFRHDGEQEISYVLSLYDLQRQAVYDLDPEELLDGGYLSLESEYNTSADGQCYLFVDWARLVEDWKMSEDFRLMLSIYGASPGSLLHGWTELNAYFDDGGREDGYFTQGDDAYTIGAPSSAARVLAISSYASRNKWTSLNGTSYVSSWNEPGKLSYFNSVGPMLDASLKKPLITAPGQLVLSAFSRQAAGIQENKPYVVRRVTQDETDYYYGLMQGTSMAAPQVAGILACWLQAYPQLTPEEAEEIIRSTAINDDFTGNVRENWDPFWGYGKIDAYAGLKECLARAASVGLSEVVGSDEPVSFRIDGREARVLFNNAEAGAVVSVYALGGTLCEERRLQAVPCAHEEVVSLAGYAPGCYLLSVETDKARVVRKIVLP
ncbi:MAG: S8 family serine peptidase [Bacteroidaceae bacterium]|jgi:minor extracellular serine protease Vpr